MFAVIKTGGKQYRVAPGDTLIVEKLDGAPGDELRFDQVLMLGEGEQITVGAPLIDGGLVRAVLVETRKGEKIKVFKKKRRQGYRRTKGHRQTESVLRVVGLEGAGRSATWDGEVKLVTRQEILARSRGLSLPTAATSAGDATPTAVHVEPIVTDETPGPIHHVAVVEHADPAPAAAAPAKKPRAKKAAADQGAFVEPPTSEVAADAPQTVEAPSPGPGARTGGPDADEQA